MAVLSPRGSHGGFSYVSGDDGCREGDGSSTPVPEVLTALQEVEPSIPVL